LDVQRMEPIRVCGTGSSHTLRQIPHVRGYQIECGDSCQSCLPRGWARSFGSSIAHDDRLRLRLPQEPRHVDRDRRESALMTRRQLTADPDRRVVVDRSKVQEETV
jgi:hypothetical protein